MRKILLATGLLILGGCQTVGTTERGIVTSWGATSGEVKEPGLHWYNPFVTSIKTMDVSIKRVDIEAAAASKDLQNVFFDGALNYQLDPTRVLEIYRQFNNDFEARIIRPSVQESIKAATALFTAEELIIQREKVKTTIKESLASRLQDYGVKVVDFNIINFNFSPSFNAAIEAKVTAEQTALAAKNKLEQVKYESEQKVAEADGKAKALKVESEAISSNPKILELRAIEKWNGVLPVYNGGGALPFINLK